MERCNDGGFIGKVMALPDNLDEIPRLHDEVIVAHEETQRDAAQVKIDTKAVVDAKESVLSSEASVTTMRDAIEALKRSIDNSEILVQRDRDVIETLLVEAQRVETEVYRNTTVAEAAANRAEAVVIPTEATYSMGSIDEGQMALLNMILENKADLEKIVIGGLNG